MCTRVYPCEPSVCPWVWIVCEVWGWSQHLASNSYLPTQMLPNVFACAPGHFFHGCLQLFDADNDRDMDVACGASDGSVVLLTNVGGVGAWPPAFSAPSILANGSLGVTALATADMDVDGARRLPCLVCGRLSCWWACAGGCGGCGG